MRRVKNIFLSFILLPFLVMAEIKYGVVINKIPLSNPSFEEEIKTEKVVETGEWGYWNKKYGKQIFDEKIAYSGKGCVKIWGENEKQNNFFHITIPVEGEKIYRISCWIKTEGVEGICGVRVNEKDENGKVLVNHGIIPKIKGTNDWKKYSYCIKTKKQSRFAFIWLELEGKGIAYFDDFSIETIEPVEGKIPNGSFEIEESPEKPLFWWGYSSGKPKKGFMYYIKDAKESHSGKHCIKVEIKEEKNYMIVIPPRIKVEPQTSYEISCWVKTGNFEGENDGAWLWIQGYESKESKHPLPKLIVEKKKKIKNAPYWQQIKVKVLTGKEINYLLILPRVDGKGVAWFDDIEIKKFE